MEIPSSTLPPVHPQENYEQGHRLFKKAFVFFLVIFFLIVAFWYGYEEGKDVSLRGNESDAILSPKDAIIINKENKENVIDFALFWKVWGILKEKYVDNDTLDARELFYGAIDGMLAATGDPYTTFFDPEENKEFQEDISGTFEGIGAEMGIKNDILIIIAPLEGMPAEKAGLLAGDKILKINGETTVNMSIEEAVKKIRGPKGTPVELNIFRNGDEESRTLTVTRDIVLVKSVRFEMREDIAVIRVSRFGEDTEKEFQAAVKQTKERAAKKVILDLRNNPGGFLDTAIEMASMMLPSGKVIVIEEDGTKKQKEMRARGGDVLSTLPTVMLINEGSASASEILAGALRENRENVTLVGKKSFGKGSVQELVSVNRETAVKITVARWLTPKGSQINNVGITPDIEISLTPSDIENDVDPQLEKAFEILRDKKE
ncbi:MAG: S41 family peptidase [Candidatus Moranbacteria bacterium]|nr:S41 family peptidase [Candidatus Moranbacteria bacterium]